MLYDEKWQASQKPPKISTRTRSRGILRSRDQKTIDNAIRLLEIPGVWMQGNEVIDCPDKECGMTALGKGAVSDASFERVKAKIETYLGGNFIDWNDRKSTTLPMVLAALRAVRELL